MVGAFFAGRRLTGPRADRLVHVQYETIFASAHTEAGLCEWVLPHDNDHVRPLPPLTPDGFHATLSVGDEVEVWHEAGFWPVKVQALALERSAVEVTSDAFPGLCRRYSITQVRPRWQWAGQEGGGWRMRKRA